MFSVFSRNFKAGASTFLENLETICSHIDGCKCDTFMVINVTHFNIQLQFSVPTLYKGLTYTKYNISRPEKVLTIGIQ